MAPGPHSHYTETFPIPSHEHATTGTRHWPLQCKQTTQSRHDAAVALFPFLLGTSVRTNDVVSCSMAWNTATRAAQHNAHFLLISIAFTDITLAKWKTKVLCSKSVSWVLKSPLTEGCEHQWWSWAITSSHCVTPWRYGLLLFGHFLNDASSESLSSQNTRSILEFRVKISYFENQEFNKVASLKSVGTPVFSTPLVAP